MLFGLGVRSAEGRRMMVGLHAALTRLHSLVRVWQRLGRWLLAALLGVLVPATVAVAPAAADPLGNVTINHLPARQCGGPVDGGAYYCVGSKPIIKIIASLTDGTGEQTFKVSNVEGSDAEDVFSEIFVTVGDAEILDPRGPAGTTKHAEVLCNVDFADHHTLHCYAPFGGVQPDDYAIFSFSYQQAAPGNQIEGLDVEFNGGSFTSCSGPYGPGAGASRDAARAADACAPPSHTRITRAKIKGHTAFFRFTARHAASFECVLIRNRQVMFRHSCHSPKPYASPLPRGNYIFIVTGVNRGGLDRKPAIKKFTVK
jgi:hypothetical protein